MARRWSILSSVVVIAVVLTIVLIEPALAAQTPAETGGKVGDFLRGLSKGMLFAVAGTIALFALVKRDVALGLLLLGMSIFVLGFLVEPSPYESFGGTALDTIFGKPDAPADAGGTREQVPGGRYVP